MVQKKIDEGFIDIKKEFISPFMEDTKVIWYQVNDGTDPIDIFSRINMGKIRLTNAELVKALFLQKCNKYDPGTIYLKQLQIASEWDKIEYTLQNNSFWYFINDNKIKYSSRIEFILDLIKDKKEEYEEYYTFNEFNKDFENKEISNKEIEVLWSNIKSYFMIFEEWYNDKELYHYIGYLVNIESKITNLNLICKLVNKYKHEFTSKGLFISDLKNEIKLKVNCQIDDIDYHEDTKKYIKPVLLLFNIKTMLFK